MPVPIPPGPPFDLDLLADLHAGVYPDDVAMSLRARVATDPQASAALAALDATVQDLHNLPPIPIPPEVAARLEAAIAAEASARIAVGASAHASSSPPVVGPPAGAVPQGVSASPSPPGPALPQPRSHPGSPPAAPVPVQPAPVSSLDQARRARETRSADRRRRQTRWATGLGIAAAAAAIFTVGAVLLHPGGTPGVGEAGQQVAATTASSGAPSMAPGAGNDTEPAPGNGAGAPSTTPTTQVTQQAIVAQPHHLDQLLPEITSSTTRGPFGDPVRLASCLAANHASTHYVLGILPVSYNGQSAYAISVRTSDSTVRILVVGPGCGQSGPDLLEEQSATG